MNKMRADFPQATERLAYFDNAATTFRCRKAIEALTQFYFEENATVGRGTYRLGQRAEELYATARRKVLEFVGVSEQDYAVIFTKNATEALNMVALGMPLRKSDVVVASWLEHHSNLLPWGRRAKIRELPCRKDGSFASEDIERAIQKGQKVLAISAWSNIFGRNEQLGEILQRAKKCGLTTVVDATQQVAHAAIDMKNVDFLAFSGHKMYAPMGIGVLVARKTMLEEMAPAYLGGGTVETVHGADEYVLRAAPEAFEAGTPNVGGAIALGAAIDWLNERGYAAKEKDALYKYLRQELGKIAEVELLPGRDMVCFKLRGLHEHDAAEYLDAEGFCVRAGYHCAQPLLDKLGYGPVIRVSLACYNTQAELTAFVAALQRYIALAYAERVEAAEHERDISAANVEFTAENASCGDKLKLQIRLRGGKIADAGFNGEDCCTIARAASEALLQEIVDKPTKVAKEIMKEYRKMLTGEKYDKKQLGELLALEKISRQPGRVNCALLPCEIADKI